MKFLFPILTFCLAISGCQVEDLENPNISQGEDEQQDTTLVAEHKVDLISPSQGFTFTENVARFSFNSSEALTAWLYIGTKEKSNDIYDGLLNTSQLDIRLPMNGEPIYLTIWNESEEEWLFTEYVFNTVNLSEDASNADANSDADQDTTVSENDSNRIEPSYLTFPLEGQVIESTDITFTISHEADNWMYLGSSKGARDIANTKLDRLSLSTVLPNNIDTLYVTIWSYIDDQWHAQHHQFDTRFNEQESTESNADSMNGSTNTGEVVDNDSEDKESTYHYADILILFNQGARNSVDENVWAASAITYLNQTLKNSETALRFRLAGVESAPKEYDRVLTSSDPERMKTDAQIQSLKEQYGADIVGMLTDAAKDWCGYSKIPKSDVEQGVIIHTNSQYFWNLLRCGQRNFAHEVGHSLGLRHSVKESPNTSGNHTWARGYGVYDRFSTMMGYASSYNKGWGNELPIFSNPNLFTCDNLKCGIDRHHEDGADAAYFINRMAPAIENLNESVLPAPLPY